MRAWWWIGVVVLAAGCGSSSEGVKAPVTTTDVVADSNGDSSGDSSADSQGDSAADTATAPTPTGVWADVSTSDSHACGLTDLGWVACWGSNADGELGDGTTQSRSAPRFIGGMDKIASVTTLEGTTCAQSSSGGLWCWGHAMAALGVQDPTRPGALLPPQTVTRLATTTSAICALFADGGAGCAVPTFVGGIKWLTLAGVTGAKALDIGDDLYWLNKDGKLQVGGFDDTVAPTQLSSQVLVDLKVSGTQVLGLDAKGQVWLLGPHDLSPPPAGCDATKCDKLTQIPGATDIVDLSTSCGRRADGTAVCWRYLPSAWQGTTATKVAAAAAIPGIGGATKLRSSFTSFAAINATGELRIWGHRASAGADVQWQPAAVTGLSGAASLIGGSAGYCALDNKGAHWCWGQHPNAAKVLAAFEDVATPYLGLGTATKLGFHSAAMCGIDAGGKVLCQGSAAPADPGLKIPDRDCQAEACSVPEAGSGITDIRAAATGGSRWCAVDTSGSVRCWGDPTGHVADLGTGSTATDTVWPPVSNPSLPAASTTCFTGGFGCALTTAGKVWCWGERANWGTSGTAPAEVKGVSDATELRCHLGAACVVNSAGAVVCWGSHMGKEAIEPLAATPVASLPPVKGLAMGGAADAEHYCAIDKGGQVWCWGQGDEGQLGAGIGTKKASTPIALAGVTNALAIAGGVQTMCATLATGEVVCWGTQLTGELGNGALPMTTPQLLAVPNGK